MYCFGNFEENLDLSHIHLSVPIDLWASVLTIFWMIFPTIFWMLRIFFKAVLTHRAWNWSTHVAFINNWCFECPNFQGDFLSKVYLFKLQGPPGLTKAIVIHLKTIVMENYCFLFWTMVHIRARSLVMKFLLGWTKVLNFGKISHF